MPHAAMIEISIDPSLLDHVKEELARTKSKIPPEDAITYVVSSILNNSPYPIGAKQTGKQEIHISYHIRSFSQPLFE